MATHTSVSRYAAQCMLNAQIDRLIMMMVDNHDDDISQIGCLLVFSQFDNTASASAVQVT